MSTRFHSNGLRSYENLDFKKKTDKVWLSINNKADMKLFQNFCCRILRLYISSINQHKKLQVIAGLAFFIILFIWMRCLELG